MLCFYVKFSPHPIPPPAKSGTRFYAKLALNVVEARRRKKGTAYPLSYAKTQSLPLDKPRHDEGLHMQRTPNATH
jgi:hypothetical protein